MHFHKKISCYFTMGSLFLTDMNINVYLPTLVRLEICNNLATFHLPLLGPTTCHSEQGKNRLGAPLTFSLRKTIVILYLINSFLQLITKTMVQSLFLNVIKACIVQCSHIISIHVPCQICTSVAYKRLYIYLLVRHLLLTTQGQTSKL